MAEANGLDLPSLIGALAEWEYTPAGRRERAIPSKVQTAIYSYRQDPDVVEGPSVMKLLAEATGLSEKDAEANRLYPKRKPLANHLLMPSGRIETHHAKGGPARQSVFGTNRLPLSYCPDCLKDSYYLRRSWRLMFVTCCPVHGRLLLDFCPKCGSDLDYYQLERAQGDGTVATTQPDSRCRACRFDLTKAPRHLHGQPINDAFLSFQRFFLQRHGWTDQRSYLVSSPSYEIAFVLVPRLASRIVKSEAAPFGERSSLILSKGFPTLRASRPSTFRLNWQLCRVRHSLLRIVYEAVEELRRRGNPMRPDLWGYLNDLPVADVGKLRTFAEERFPAFLAET